MAGHVRTEQAHRTRTNYFGKIYAKNYVKHAAEARKWIREGIKKQAAACFGPQIELRAQTSYCFQKGLKEMEGRLGNESNR